MQHNQLINAICNKKSFKIIEDRRKALAIAYAQEQDEWPDIPDYSNAVLTSRDTIRTLESHELCKESYSRWKNTAPGKKWRSTGGWRISKPANNATDKVKLDAEFSARKAILVHQFKTERIARAIDLFKMDRGQDEWKAIDDGNFFENLEATRVEDEQHPNYF